MFEIFAPSYKRAIGKSTHKILPDVTYVVSESEKDDYLKSGEHNRFWFVPPSAQGNLCRIRNYILDNSKSKKILLLDDDHTRFGRWENNKRTVVDTEQIMEFIADMFELCDQGDFKFWGVLPNNDNMSYRNHTPYSLSSYVGGPWQGFNDCALRYDENLPLKEDYDMTLQVLNKYRKLLRANYFIYYPKQHNNTGGCAVYRNTIREVEQLKLLKKKWGSRIVKDGSKHSIGKTTNRESATEDINPIISIPIKGI
jgi:hypothetical protein